MEGLLFMMRVYSYEKALSSGRVTRYCYQLFSYFLMTSHTLEYILINYRNASKAKL